MTNVFAKTNARRRQRTVIVSGYGPDIGTFAFDETSGRLSRRATSRVGHHPSFLTVSADRRFLYAVDEIADGRVIALAFDATSGSLRLLNVVSAGGSGPCHVAMHPSGRWLFTANYGCGHIAVLPIRSDGQVGEPTSVLHPGRNAHQVVLDASGQFVFVPCLGSDAIAQYRFDAERGQLTPNDQPMIAGKAGSGPRHLVLHEPSGTAFGLNELNNTMTGYRYDGVVGCLTTVMTTPTLPAAFTGPSSGAHVLITPDGRTVYGSNRGHDSVVVFTQDQGQLTLQGWATSDATFRTPRHFAMSSAGDWLLVAGQDSGSVMSYRIDPRDGGLVPMAFSAVGGSPSWVGIIDDA